MIFRKTTTTQSIVAGFYEPLITKLRNHAADRHADADYHDTKRSEHQDEMARHRGEAYEAEDIVASLETAIGNTVQSKRPEQSKQS